MPHRRGKMLGFGTMVLCLAVAASASAQSGPATYHEFTITAKKYAFDPAVIKLTKGEKVRLLITAIDHDHGFKLDAFDIDQVLKKGETETIEFTAGKAGTFEFKCSVYCGLGHGKMKGKLVVEESSANH